mgnify:FL=1
MIKKLLILYIYSTSALVQADDLLSIYDQALNSDPNLKAAQLQTELSEAQQAQAGGALLPQASANVNISYNNQYTETSGADSYKGERYSVNLTQSLIDVSKVYNWQRAKALTDKSEMDFQQEHQVLMFDVVERYFTVLAMQDNLSLIRQETETTEKQLKQIQRQYDKHIVKITDVYELEAKLDSLLAEDIEAETQLDVAKQSLTELTGQPVMQLANLQNDIQFTPLAGDIQSVTEQAQANSPLIKAQDKEITAGDYDVISQHAKHLPVVDLQLQYYNTDNGFQNRQTPTVDTKVAAINVTIPLFAGGATYQRAKEASRQLAISKQRKISLLRGIEKETRDAFLSANASVRRIKASIRAQTTAIKAREAMEKGFTYGVQSIGDVLISQAREFSANRDLLEAKYTYIKNRIRFERSLGTLSINSLSEINAWLIN